MKLIISIAGLLINIFNITRLVSLCGSVKLIFSPCNSGMQIKIRRNPTAFSLTTNIKIGRKVSMIIFLAEK
jgi:hypothetical protein